MLFSASPSSSYSSRPHGFTTVIVTGGQLSIAGYRRHSLPLAAPPPCRLGLLAGKSPSTNTFLPSFPPMAVATTSRFRYHLKTSIIFIVALTPGQLKPQCRAVVYLRTTWVPSARLPRFCTWVDRASMSGLIAFCRIRRTNTGTCWTTSERGDVSYRQGMIHCIPTLSLPGVSERMFDGDRSGARKRTKTRCA